MEAAQQQNSDRGYCCSNQAFVSDSLKVDYMKKCGVGDI